MGARRAARSSARSTTSSSTRPPTTSWPTSCATRSARSSTTRRRRGKLSPTNVIGCKRLCVDTGYYATFNRPNVELVDINDAPIDRFTATGLVIGGVEHEFDSIVLATGFDAMTGAILRVDIRGRDGVPLQRGLGGGPAHVPRAAGGRLPEPVHDHRPGQPVGAHQHDRVDRAPRRVDRRHDRAPARRPGARRSNRRRRPSRPVGRDGERDRRLHAVPDVQLVVPGRQRARASRASSCRSSASPCTSSRSTRSPPTTTAASSAPDPCHTRTRVVPVSIRTRETAHVRSTMRSVPLYEFRCRTCDDVFEVRRPMSESSAPAPCPDGHADTVRLLSVFANAGSASSIPVAGAPPGGWRLRRRVRAAPTEHARRDPVRPVAELRPAVPRQLPRRRHVAERARPRPHRAARQVRCRHRRHRRAVHGAEPRATCAARSSAAACTTGSTGTGCSRAPCCSSPSGLFVIPSFDTRTGLFAAFVLTGLGGAITDLGANTLLMWELKAAGGRAMNTAPPVLRHRRARWRHCWCTSGSRSRPGRESALCLVLAAWSFTIPAPQRPAVAREEHTDTTIGLLALLGLFFTLYVGTEIGFAGWIKTYGEEIDFTPLAATWLTTVFWIGFTLGRAVASALAHRVTADDRAVGVVLRHRRRRRGADRRWWRDRARVDRHRDHGRCDRTAVRGDDEPRRAAHPRHGCGRPPGSSAAPAWAA